MIDADELHRLVAAEIAAAGSQRAWAERNGLSPAYVNVVVRRRRDPGASIVDALGLERVVCYRKKL